MIAMLLAGALLAAPPVSDTTLSVRRGDVILIQNFSGSLDVRTWDRSEVDIEFRESKGVRFDVTRGGGRVEVRVADRKGRDRNREYVITVPTWLEMEIRGRDLDVTVTGLEAGLKVTSQEGDISIRDHSGTVVARSMDGLLEVSQSRGRFELTSLDDDVSVFDVRGELFIDTNDGDIEMVDVDASTVSASTMDGYIEFSGVVHSDGRYELVTHDGDITFAVQPGAEANVSVVTYHGEFETEFPIVLQRLESGRELNFDLGGGGARVRLQAFDGDIRLKRNR